VHTKLTHRRRPQAPHADAVLDCGLARGWQQPLITMHAQAAPAAALVWPARCALLLERVLTKHTLCT
jgi:hypothetical protein